MDDSTDILADCVAMDRSFRFIRGDATSNAGVSFRGGSDRPFELTAKLTGNEEIDNQIRHLMVLSAYWALKFASIGGTIP